jgi:hypothetical protein
MSASIHPEVQQAQKEFEESIEDLLAKAAREPAGSADRRRLITAARVLEEAHRLFCEYLVAAQKVLDE